MNIYLIGYRCSGKTTLGRALADWIGWRFVDMDDQLVAEQGRSIAEMVRQSGWDGFRQLEKALLSRIARHPRQVVGSGGGVILDPSNVTAMHTSGKLVWLRCRPETIVRRMDADPRSGPMRPALTDQGVLEEIATTLEQREPLYRLAADLTIDTDQVEVAQVCRQVAELLGLAPCGGP